MSINYISEEVRVYSESIIDYGVRILGRTEIRENCTSQDYSLSFWWKDHREAFAVAVVGFGL